MDLELHMAASPALSTQQLAERQLWYVNEEGEPEDVNLHIWKVADYFQCHYSDGTEFFIRHDTKEVWATWPAHLSLEDTLIYFLGPIMGFILRLRGTLGLHASSVVHAGKAFALLGISEAGKSTTAAMFAKLGYKVLSDDLSALDIRDGVYWVQPGYPYVRLWPESAEILFGSSEALPRLTPTWEKCYFDLMPSNAFQRQPVPLAAIYFLGKRSQEEPSITPIVPSEAFMTLLASTNANYLLTKDMRAKEFSVLSRLVADIPLRQVQPSTDPTRLAALCHLILEDFENLPKVLEKSKNPVESKNHV
jgi:hypothetical protein